MESVRAPRPRAPSWVLSSSVAQESLTGIQVPHSSEAHPALSLGLMRTQSPETVLFSPWDRA